MDCLVGSEAFLANTLEPIDEEVPTYSQELALSVESTASAPNTKVANVSAAPTQCLNEFVTGCVSGKLDQGGRAGGLKQFLAGLTAFGEIMVKDGPDVLLSLAVLIAGDVVGDDALHNGSGVSAPSTPKKFGGGVVELAQSQQHAMGVQQSQGSGYGPIHAEFPPRWTISV